jgi:glycosyltransferase involved in cell wall biosynthesis
MKISVVMPLYNKRGTIIRALNSVFNQTYLPNEIVVVNDGSTDGSEQIIAKLSNPLIKLFHQSNGGVSSARNKGIEESKGDWIAFLDADDEWMPEYLETIKSLSEKFPQCSVLATSYLLQDYKGFRSNIILNKIPFNSEKGLLCNYFEVATCSHPPLWTSAVVVKKTAIEAVGGFPVGIYSGEDLLTWAKLAINSQIGYCTKPLSVFIQDDNAVPRIPQSPDLVAKQLKSLLNSQTNNNRGIRVYISLWHKMRVIGYLDHGQRKNALNEIVKSIKYNLFSKSWILLPFVFLNKKYFKAAIKWYRK